MEKVIRKFSSFAEAEQADDEYYSNLSYDERLRILLRLVADYQAGFGGNPKGLERVYRIVKCDWR